MIKDELPGLTLDQILAADDLKPVPVDCPEWGGRVFVRGLSGEARDKIEERVSAGGSMIGLRALLVSEGLCQEDGTPYGMTPQQVDQLGSKSAGVLSRLADRIQSLSGMSAEDVERLEKNLETTPSDGSGTG